MLLMRTLYVEFVKIGIIDLCKHSILYELMIICNCYMSNCGQAERSVIVSTTGRTKGRNSFDKATRVVELLATTHVPPYLVQTEIPFVVIFF